MLRHSDQQLSDHDLGMVGSYGVRPPSGESTSEAELERAQRLVAEAELDGLDDVEMSRLTELARMYFERKAYAEAMPSLHRLLTLTRAHAPDGPEVATVLSGLARAHHAVGEHNEAARLSQEALEIRERCLVPNHFLIARSLEQLADVRVAQGQVEESITLLRRALAIWQQTLSPDDPTLATARAKIAGLELLASQERADSSADDVAPSPEPRAFGGYAPEPTVVWGALGADRSKHEPAADMHTPDALDSLRERVVGGPATSDPAAARGDSPIAFPFYVDPSAAGRHEAKAVEDAPRRADQIRAWMTRVRALLRGVAASLAARRAPVRPPQPRAAGKRAARSSRRVPIAAATLGVVAIVLMVAAWLVTHGSASSSAAAANLAASDSAVRPSPPASAAQPRKRDAVVRQVSAGLVGLEGREQPAPASTGGDRSGSEESRSAASASAPDMRSLPLDASAQIAAAVQGVESATVAQSDSMVRSMLYGRALSLGAGREAFTMPGGEGARDSAQATSADSQDTKAAVLIPGTARIEFPDAMLSDNHSGRVVVELMIDADGHADPSSARVVHSDHPLLTSAVLRAVPTMRFVPAESHGRRVNQRLEVPFRFARVPAGQ